MIDWDNKGKMYWDGEKNVPIGEREEISSETLKKRARLVLDYYQENFGIKTDDSAIKM